MVEPKSEVMSTSHEFESSRHEISLNDNRDVDRFGYKPELPRRFGLWSMIGLSCTIMITWEAWFTTSNVSLTNGGKAGSVYNYLFCWLGYSAVVASLAELVSMIPTAGGQYHWTFELAPARYRKFISWITGWQIVLAWQADLAAVVYITASMLQSLAILNYPDYDFKRWHATLIIWGLILVIICFNTVLVRSLPLLEGGILVIHCLSFFVVLVPLICLGTPHASAREVFTQFYFDAGYSNGLSWFVGLITTVFAFLGADGAIHMSEEVINSRVAVPQALMASVAINGILGFAMVLAMMFTVGDLTTALQTETGFIFIDYFARALHSDGFASGLVSILLVLFFAAGVAVLASASRVTWAFARDDGLPGSSWLKKVSPAYQLPVNSIIFSAVISFLLSFINIGSSVAFNAIVSLVVAAYFGSYMIPISIMTWMRITKRSVEMGPWNLGKLGLPINIFSLIWLAITWFFSFFPVAVPVTASSMNWSCALWSFIMLFGVVWYFAYQRHRFTGPTVVVRA